MVHVENVAVYWDFENIHASLINLKEGNGTYNKLRETKQRIYVNIEAIMEYIKSLGNININKAYGNWEFFCNYSKPLQDHAIDLFQMFPRGSHGKNGADIRMATDVIEDISMHRQISVVVVLSGDSDFIAVAQKVRQTGRKVVGIGVEGAVNQFWVQSCNEFKYYDALLLKAEPSATQPAQVSGVLTKEEKEKLAQAGQLLRRAVLVLSEKKGGGSVPRAAVKPMMLQLEPSFDEANFKFKSFTKFLEHCSDVVTLTKGENDHFLGLVEQTENAGALPNAKAKAKSTTKAN